MIGFVFPRENEDNLFRINDSTTKEYIETVLAPNFSHDSSAITHFEVNLSW